MEECFGVVWEEILQQTHLNDSDQAKVYEELIAWAKELAPKN